MDRQLLFLAAMAHQREVFEASLRPYSGPDLGTEGHQVVGGTPTSFPTMGIVRKPQTTEVRGNRREGPNYKFIDGKRTRLRGYRRWSAR